MLRVAVICVFDRKQSELGTGQCIYTVILLVSPLGSLMNAKFISLSEHCFVVSQLYMYTTFGYLVCIFMDNTVHIYYVY